MNGQGSESQEAQEQVQEKEPSIRDDALTSLVKELTDAHRQAGEYKDNYLRSVAEYQNLKRRTAKEMADIQLNANASLLRKVFPIVDDFQRALANVPQDLEGHPWLNGVKLIERKLSDILRSEGIEPIPTEGYMFDPNLHEAVVTEEVAGMPEGMITAELQKGYKLGERILRPAMVRVAR